MIALTRFDGTVFYLNADFIEYIEETPDTVISTITHNKLRVRESAEEVLQRVVAFRQRAAFQPAAIRALLRWGSAHPVIPGQPFGATIDPAVDEEHC